MEYLPRRSRWSHPFLASLESRRLAAARVTRKWSTISPAATVGRSVEARYPRIRRSLAPSPFILGELLCVCIGHPNMSLSATVLSSNVHFKCLWYQREMLRANQLALAADVPPLRAPTVHQDLGRSHPQADFGLSQPRLGPR